jgi:hypothetical protein
MRTFFHLPLSLSLSLSLSLAFSLALLSPFSTTYLEQVITSFWRKPQQTKHLNETLTSTSSCYYDESRSLEDEARLGNLLKENFFTMKTFPPIHPLKANKHGVMKQIPAGIILPVTCFPPTRLNSMNRRSTKQGRKRANYLQPARNFLQIGSAKILHNR